MSTLKATTRYEYGGDEFVFVELSEEMSLEALFKVLVITQNLEKKQLPGIIDICPGNASYMIRIDPDMIHPDDLIRELKEIERNMDGTDNIKINSRLIEIPALFDDPWTHEALMKFRKNHQDPNATDLEYAARINGFDSKEKFIDHFVSYPFIVSMLGFVPSLPFYFQLVDRKKQIEVPKYVTPRTFTPARAIGFGGAFGSIYPVDGAGGYQLLGIVAPEILDTEQKLSDFKDSMVFFRQNDIMQFRNVTMDEYKEIRSEVESGTFKYNMKEISYSLKEIIENPEEFAKRVRGVLKND
ncbi:carboxyltransferase domain-containing protein [Bacillus salipaludis]|uniref:Carboxyltransferase domain-containing protein n=1 Tax=Bacillus salipaludis TaxID=2547811 RepID=A0A4R5VRB6_9BACI|nr:carboxyltransferase domain-containing protein [Bacillus salipaludis]TDK60956.1 carboxyltransferase domain-containing protein [Bacillus salipaludis]